MTQAELLGVINHQGGRIIELEGIVKRLCNEKDRLSTEITALNKQRLKDVDMRWALQALVGAARDLLALPGVIDIPSPPEE